MLRVDGKRIEQLKIFSILVFGTFSMIIRIKTLQEYGCAALLVLSNNLSKIPFALTIKISYPRIEIMTISIFCVISNFLGNYAFCAKLATSLSFTICFYQHILFLALIIYVVDKKDFTPMQYLGLSILYSGFILNLSEYNSLSEVPKFIYLSLLSGVFLCFSKISFRYRIKPGYERFDNYMLEYNVCSLIFSMIFFFFEFIGGSVMYKKLFNNYLIYTLFVVDVINAFLVSNIADKLNSLDRKTLINVVCFTGAIFSDIILQGFLDGRLLISFFLTVAGIQMFNFYKQ